MEDKKTKNPKKSTEDNQEKDEIVSETIEKDSPPEIKREGETEAPQDDGEGQTEEEDMTIEKVNKEVKVLKRELEEQKDKYMRLFAEYENYRKRTGKEAKETYSKGLAEAVKSFLPLIDSLEKAEEFSPDDEGIKALTKLLSDILSSLGVTTIESDGQCFDPNLHNAIMHEEDENTEGCKVVQTFQKGYMLCDNVIRHAMVKVVN
jgi:molecular chaperone GrpE